MGKQYASIDIVWLGSSTWLWLYYVMFLWVKCPGMIAKIKKQTRLNSHASQQMIEEVLELCQEATPPSCYREKRGEVRGSRLRGRGRGEYLYFFSLKCRPRFWCQGKLTGGEAHRGRPLLSIQPWNVGVASSQRHMRSLCFPECRRANEFERPGPLKDTV